MIRSIMMVGWANCLRGLLIFLDYRWLMAEISYRPPYRGGRLAKFDLKVENKIRVLYYSNRICLRAFLFPSLLNGSF